MSLTCYSMATYSELFDAPNQSLFVHRIALPLVLGQFLSD